MIGGDNRPRVNTPAERGDPMSPSDRRWESEKRPPGCGLIHTTGETTGSCRNAKLANNMSQ